MTIYVPKEDLLQDNVVRLNKNKSNYLSRVMRCKKGDLVHIIDGVGGRYEASIFSITEKAVSLNSFKKIGNDDIFYNTILFQAILKGQSMDRIIREVVECGIKEVYPIITERTIVKETNKIKRWQSIAEEASEQSGRSHIPIIHKPITLETVIDVVKDDKETCKILFHQAGSDLQDYINRCHKGSATYFIIGPEGGLTIREIALLTKNGFETITIGRFTLKSETMASVATTLIHYFIDKHPIAIMNSSNNDK